MQTHIHNKTHVFIRLANGSGFFSLLVGFVIGKLLKIAVLVERFQEMVGILNSKSNCVYLRKYICHTVKSVTIDVNCPFSLRFMGMKTDLQLLVGALPALLDLFSRWGFLLAMFAVE